MRNFHNSCSGETAYGHLVSSYPLNGCSRSEQPRAWSSFRDRRIKRWRRALLLTWSCWLLFALSACSGVVFEKGKDVGSLGGGSPTVKALNCSSAAMAGPGADACIVTLTAPAPIGGLSVDLSSSSLAVSVQKTVIVPANATSAGFTATVFAVAAAQAVTMTASTGSVVTSFTLQLNAAILALSINANSVAFGDVMVNTPATQSLTMTSSGTAPVMIDGATLTGAGFTLPAAALPATLSPGQEATLNIEFDPTVVGAATGQLTITSNSSTSGTMVIGLAGTGAAASGVAVAVTPSNASTTIGATQQFVASVTGTSNTAVTWTASGTSCSGATCGTISSSGLYTAPAAVPSSAVVTITAASQSDPTKLATAEVSIVPPQAAGYSLAWEDTFAPFSYCTVGTPGCNWYGPGLYWHSVNNGVVTDPSNTYANLNWLNTQTASQSSTNMSTISQNGAYHHAWTFGYFEISMAFNPAPGQWPAVWLMPVSMAQPGGTVTGGEIDIFEWFSEIPTLGGGTANVWSNGKMIATNSKGGKNLWSLPAGTNLANYNTYGLLWTPTSISWYFNNALVETFNTTASPYSTVFAGQAASFLILSEQAGCNSAYTSTKPCPGQSSPLNMQVRWVHVFSPQAP